MGTTTAVLLKDSSFKAYRPLDHVSYIQARLMYEHLLLLAFPSQNSGNDEEIRREDHGSGPASRFSATLYATNYSAASQTRVAG